MLTKTQSESLLRLIWSSGALCNKKLVSKQGHSVVVKSVGLASNIDGVDFVDVKIEIDGGDFLGRVAIHDAASDWYRHGHDKDPRCDSVALHVVGVADVGIMNINAMPVPVVEVRYPKSLALALEDISYGRCQVAARNIPQHEKISALTRLYVERFERKSNDLMQILDSVNGSWHEAMYVYLFGAMNMGSAANKESLMRLAREVPYSVVMRESVDPVAVDALLLGVAGALAGEPMDDYSYELKKRFRTLQMKYSNDVINFSRWQNGNLRPQNLPIRRLVHLAHLIAKPEFTFESIMALTSGESARKMFDFELREYWRTHSSLAVLTSHPSGIGATAAEILVINFIGPLMFSYGRAIGDQELCERALRIVGEQQPEDNRYVNHWRSCGIVPENALFSQALVQLSSAYCNSRRCTECFIGRRVFRELMVAEGLLNARIR